VEVPLPFLLPPLRRWLCDPSACPLPSLRAQVNMRPHDWDMLTDASFGGRHFGTYLLSSPPPSRWAGALTPTGCRYYDYGAVGLHLALDLDPTPLFYDVQPAFKSALATVRPVATLALCAAPSSPRVLSC
jgi:hypothetical protein